MIFGATPCVRFPQNTASWAQIIGLYVSWILVKVPLHATGRGFKSLTAHQRN
jgi:hypothetical protein